MTVLKVGSFFHKFSTRLMKDSSQDAAKATKYDT
jgi:hypothetical protein